jgi:hypothetical protein
MSFIYFSSLIICLGFGTEIEVKSCVKSIPSYNFLPFKDFLTDFLHFKDFLTDFLLFKDFLTDFLLFKDFLTDFLLFKDFLADFLGYFLIFDFMLFDFFKCIFICIKKKIKKDTRKNNKTIAL